MGDIKAVMKKVFMILGCAILLISCSEEVTETSTDNFHSTGDIDFPNSNTRTEIIQTSDNLEKDGVISKLISDLKREKFELEKRDIHPHTSFYDPDNEVQFVMRGNGMKAFAFKRTEAKPKNYYPDFILTVFEFKTESEARSCLDKINAALTGGKFANGKGPHATVRNNQEVYYFSTRAEMFREYIDDCIKRVESYLY